MGWTTPRTWADGEIPLGHGDHTDAAAGGHSDVADTALSFNVQLRDNLDVLAVARGTSREKFAGLAAAYLLDLDGTNLTGLALLAADNTYTAQSEADGSSSGRVVVPVGTDKYVLVSHTDHTDGAHTDIGVKGAGSVWVEGEQFHYVNDIADEWYHAGSAVGHTDAAALAGSVWVEDNDPHWISATNVEYRLIGRTTSMHSDAAARRGSAWLETHPHWIRETGTQEYDGTHADSHSDSAHSDVAHVDTHSDSHSDSTTAHADVHSDTGHTDTHADHTDVGHGDGHGDIAHQDAHTDVAGSHTDTHGDSHTDTHTDVAHSDSHTDVAPVNVGTWP